MPIWRNTGVYIYPILWSVAHISPHDTSPADSLQQSDDASSIWLIHWLMSAPLIRIPTPLDVLHYDTDTHSPRTHSILIRMHRHPTNLSDYSSRTINLMFNIRKILPQVNPEIKDLLPSASRLGLLDALFASCRPREVRATSRGAVPSNRRGRPS